MHASGMKVRARIRLIGQKLKPSLKQNTTY